MRSWWSRRLRRRNRRRPRRWPRRTNLVVPWPKSSFLPALPSFDGASLAQRPGRHARLYLAAHDGDGEKGSTKEPPRGRRRDARPVGTGRSQPFTAGPRRRRPSARRSTACGAGSSRAKGRRCQRGLSPKQPPGSSPVEGSGASSTQRAWSFTPTWGARSSRSGRPWRPTMRPPATPTWSTISAPAARGSRYDHAVPLLRELTGAEDALVVNNCAGATLLALSAVVASKASEAPEVIVSRGQLIEIGGGFRIPEVLALSGARLREVGTTNRTRLSDYENAVNENTRAVLWVHPSNFETVGFTESVGVADLTSLGLPVIADVGSGALLSVGEEPRVQDTLSDGADLAIFSGDKLLGGPQAGIAVGSFALDLRHAPPSSRPRPPRRQALPRRPGSDPELLPRRHRRKDLPTLRMIRTPVPEVEAEGHQPRRGSETQRARSRGGRGAFRSPQRRGDAADIRDSLLRRQARAGPTRKPWPEKLRSGGPARDRPCARRKVMAGRADAPAW